MATSSVGGTPSFSADSLDALRRSLSGTTAAAAEEDANGEDRFLALLVAQLKNQDPLNPLDNAQVTSQLAQINTVKGLGTLNDSVNKLGDLFTSSQTLTASSLIGRTVLTEGSKVQVGASGTITTGFQLDSQADSVQASIVDASGKTVFSQAFGQSGAGVYPMTWDGMNGSTRVPDGNYTLKVSAMAGTQAVTATPLTATQVQGVRPDAGGVQVTLTGGKTLAMADVRQIL